MGGWRCGMGGWRCGMGSGSGGLFRISAVQHQTAQQRQNSGHQKKSGPNNVAKSKHFHLKNSSILFP
jgi:hypothetical protein